MSDIQAYDTALLDYFKQVTDKVYYAPTEGAKSKNSKMNGDRTYYPFLSFYRDTDLQIDDSRMNVSMTQGHFTRMNQTSPSDDLHDTHYEHFIPVNLMYQVDVWSAKHADLLSLSQELLIDLKSARKVLEVPTSDGKVARFEFRDVSWVDNSDLESEDETGRKYRHTFSFIIEAYISKVKVKRKATFQNASLDIYE